MGGARCGVGELSITLAHACAFARFGGERERVERGGVREGGRQGRKTIISRIILAASALVSSSLTSLHVCIFAEVNIRRADYCHKRYAD